MAFNSKAVINQVGFVIKSSMNVLCKPKASLAHSEIHELLINDLKLQEYESDDKLDFFTVNNQFQSINSRIVYLIL